MLRRVSSMDQDADAVEQLYAAVCPGLIGYLTVLGGNRADAEDIAQDVCVKLGSVIAQFDGRSAFSSWVYRITLNAVRDMQRAGKRRGRHADAYAEVSPEDQPAEQEEAATSRQLWEAVRKLPEKQRDAVLLVYAEDLSHAAAADIMGIREATVSWHVHEARKTLRGLL